MSPRSIETVRASIDGEVFSDSHLAGIFPDQRVREGRVQRMVMRGELLRLKRGYFAFGDTYRRSPIPTYYLANMLRGPSYISLESALSFYGMIPEAVYAMTSVILSRTTSITTPLGLFTYRLIPESAFPYGVTIQAAGRSPFLIGTKEKALLDKFYLDCIEVDLFDVAVRSLRIEENDIRNLDLDAVVEIATLYKDKRFRDRIMFFVERASL